MSDDQKPPDSPVQSPQPDLTEHDLHITTSFGKHLALQALTSPLWEAMSTLHAESGPAIGIRASYLSTAALAHAAALTLLSCLRVDSSTAPNTREDHWVKFQITCRATFDIAFDDVLAEKDRLERATAATKQNGSVEGDSAIARALTSATAAAAAGEQEGEA